MKKSVLKTALILFSAVLIMSLMTGCTDNKKFLVIVEKGNSEQISFAKTITTNDNKSVQFIDENERDQYLTGDYITISAIKPKDENLIILKSNGILSLIFPVKIIESTDSSVKYLDEKGVQQQLQGEITIIKIRTIK
ncbi:MAG TPA: hypothetical protein VF347_02380 [Candidatus Humimicrobiaceae bacterium]